jgi:hypothetical protein
LTYSVVIAYSLIGGLTKDGSISPYD